MTANQPQKSIKKRIILALAAVVGVVAISVTSVLATVAYLTSSAAVSNVFTIGNAVITMTESKVNSDGTLFDEGNTRVDTNTYHLVPNKTYVKDPTIFVQQGSEDLYLFVIVRNDIENIECQNTDHTVVPAGAQEAEHKGTIAEQLGANGWAKCSKASTGWVYVYVGFEETVVDGVKTKGASKAGAFEEALAAYQSNPEQNPLPSAAAVKPGEYVLFEQFSIAKDANVSTYGAAKITLTGVGIQTAGFADINEAWAAVIETYPYIHTGTTSQG